MKARAKAMLIATCIVWTWGCVGLAEDAAESQHAVIGISAKTTAEEHPSSPPAPWFGKAGLGLFVHFGIASVGGHQDLSWSMVKNTPWNKQNAGVLTPKNYYALAEKFAPNHFDPDKWLKAAKEAGFGYAVFTARHHDGFALWPSAYGELSTKNYLGGRDLVREFIAGCRKNGLKVGLYYSSPDWYRERTYKSWGYNNKETPRSAYLDMNHQPVESLPPRPENFEADNAAYLNGQLHELLGNYGRIDYLWFDGSQPGVISQSEIRKLQPGILINDRQHGGGDVITARYENKLPAERPEYLWEHCFSMVGAWGYTQPVHCQPAEIIETKLAATRTWGGNVLADFGPQPDGDMPPEYYECLAQLKAWMSWAAPAVVGVRPGPYPEKCSVPITLKDGEAFAFLPPKKSDDLTAEDTIFLKSRTAPRSVHWLETGQRLSVVTNAEGYSIKVPAELRNHSVGIVKMETAALE